ncbi:hypothetical protein BDV93DRAFT_567066 [Ceratobasidium sp. AG-I]|nr:hypothetical protein BDV93DRAFT_567066 [Ceratobasidium sp. AG-I]
MPPSLEVEDAVCLLIKSAYLAQQGISTDDNKALRGIAKYFGWFPPVIVQVGTVIQGSGLTLQASQQALIMQNQEWIKQINISLDPLLYSNYRKCIEPARMLLRLLGFLPFKESLLRNVLIRTRNNFTSYQPLILGELGVEQIKEENETLLSLFTSTSHGSTDCSKTFDDAITDLQEVFGLQSGSHGEGWGRCAHDWARSISNQPFTEASAAYLLAASIGSGAEHGIDCCAFRSQLEPLVFTGL